jgi:outer membrane PBP1 activator LpoA protein
VPPPPAEPPAGVVIRPLAPADAQLPAPQPAPPQPLPAPGERAAPAGNGTIALVLPLQSSNYGRAADAVRAGFMAAAERAGMQSRIRVMGYADDGVLDAIESARQAGATLIVGPLTRDDVRTVLSMAPARPRLLALNQSEDPAVLPDDAWAMSLALDGDAALLARTARADGARTVAIVVGAAPLQQRFAAAFAQQWQAQGGAPPREYRFDPNPDTLAVLRREMGSRPTDTIMLAVDSEHATLAKSFIPPGPVYASSQIADELSMPLSHDLDGVRFVEIPWVADPGSPELASLPRKDQGSPVLDRLYALGLDAFALAQMLSEPVPPRRVELDGATGHLSLTPAHVFSREGRVMEIRDGRARPLAP